MEFPEPTIDVEAAARAIILGTGEIGERPGRDGTWPAREHLQALLAQAWEEGRWSPPGACLNPYGEPAATITRAGTEGFSGLRFLKLYELAHEALVALEGIPSTVRRTGARRVTGRKRSCGSLVEQLRAVLGGK